MWARSHLLLANVCRVNRHARGVLSNPVLKTRLLSQVARGFQKLRRSRGEWLLGTSGLSGGFLAYYAFVRRNAAACKERGNTNTGNEQIATGNRVSSDGNQAFDWALFAKFIWPDWFFLLVAVGVSSNKLQSITAYYLQ